MFETKGYQPSVIPSKNGFYVEDKNAYKWNTGYTRTRFVWDGGKFVPLFEQEVKYLMINPEHVSGVSFSYAKTLIMNRPEVKRFISVTPDYVLQEDEDDEGFYFSFHERGNGTIPLWNFYNLNRKGEITEMWTVFDDEGNWICNQGADPDCWERYINSSNND